MKLVEFVELKFCQISKILKFEFRQIDKFEIEYPIFEIIITSCNVIKISVSYYLKAVEFGSRIH